MFTLTKDFRFEAAHHLPKHDGKCQRVHGHSWVGRIEVTGGALQPSGPKAGMLVDYADLSAAIEPWWKNYLDHWDLNETTKLENPTSEELARWIFLKLKPSLPGLAAVEIEETCTCKARYSE